MLAHAAHILNSFKATGSNTDRTLIFQTVDQFFDFCSTKNKFMKNNTLYGVRGDYKTSFIVKVSKIKYLIDDRKKKMGIKNLPEKPTNWFLGIIEKFKN